MEFRWNDWNVDHVQQHGVDPAEAEWVADTARAPYPLKIQEDKWIVWGQTWAGRWLQVVYVDDVGDRVYIIHARPLREIEKRRFRRRQR